MTRSSQILVPKAFGANHDKVVGGSINSKVDKMVKNLFKSKMSEKYQKTPKFAKARSLK